MLKELLGAICVGAASIFSISNTYAESRDEYYAPYPGAYQYAPDPRTYQNVPYAGEYDYFPYAPAYSLAPSAYNAPRIYAYRTPPAAYYYAHPEPVWVPLRPRSCGRYRFWNGQHCVDARYQPPYLGPRW
jgi:hypothetical protein